MGGIGVEGTVEVRRVERMSRRTHRDFRHPTEARKVVGNSRRMVALHLLAHLPKLSDPLGHVRVRISGFFGHYRLRHPD